MFTNWRWGQLSCNFSIRHLLCTVSARMPPRGSWQKALPFPGQKPGGALEPADCRGERGGGESCWRDRCRGAADLGEDAFASRPAWGCGDRMQRFVVETCRLWHRLSSGRWEAGKLQTALWLSEEPGPEAVSWCWPGWESRGPHRATAVQERSDRTGGDRAVGTCSEEREIFGMWGGVGVRWPLADPYCYSL